MIPEPRAAAETTVIDLNRDADYQELRRRLMHHPLYQSVRTPDDVRTFMEHHVFCVWDFQSLLKALQRRLTCVEVPWQPTADRQSRRWINAIVLGEESDEDGRGGYASHFELYLEAMADAGADTGRIETFLDAIRRGQPLDAALHAAGTPSATAAFVRQTLSLVHGAELHRVGAAFALGREDPIPAMFVQLLQRQEKDERGRMDRFLYYLQRHIDLDGDEHGPAAHQLLERLCGDDAKKQNEALATARECLGLRLAVWDEIATALRRGKTAGV
jgi:hypothetical protein